MAQIQEKSSSDAINYWISFVINWQTRGIASFNYYSKYFDLFDFVAIGYHFNFAIHLYINKDAFKCWVPNKLD